MKPVDPSSSRNEDDSREAGDSSAEKPTFNLRETVTTPLSSANPPAGNSWGPLQLREKLGEGGFGEVYRAYDPTLEREVALKVRHTAAGPESEELLEEGRRLARFKHPNVLSVYGAAEHDGRVGIWTDLLEGQTLESYLEAQGFLNADEATLIGLEICKAVSAIHGAGLIHRDIKASNVMREKGGRIVLLDFGSVSPSVAAGQASSAGIEGTPLYMAPEQLMGEPPEPTQDIYAVGVLLYHLVCGKYPVSARSITELIENHMAERRVPLRDARPDLPGTFVRVVERALAPSPVERFPSAGALETALQGCLSATTSREEPMETRASGTRFPWPTAIAGIVLLGALAGLFAYAPWRGLSEFELRAAFFRVLDDGRQVRVRAGDEVDGGDLITLEIEPSKEVFLYVFNEDEAGTTLLLFPDPELVKSNPLPAEQVHELPGRVESTGDRIGWEVTSGGTEQIIIIASRKKLEDLEKDLDRYRSPGSPTRLSDHGKRMLRGLDDKKVLPTGPASTEPRLGDFLDDLAEGSGRSRDGVFLRKFVLYNPK